MALLRVATFNLLHGMAPASGATDPDLLRAAVRELDADLLGLQEVDRHQLRTGGVDQAALVAEALDAPWRRFVPAVHGTPAPVPTWSPATVQDGEDSVGPTYGIGLVSRLPVRSWWVKRFRPAPFRLPLPVLGQPRLVLVPDEPRLALAAVIEGPAGPFTFATTHLSFVPGYNVGQLRALAAWLARMPQPVFLTGDFNVPAPLPARLTGWQSLVAAPTYPAHAPRVQLDHVLALGVGSEQVVDSRSWTLGVSDHRAVSVDLDVAAFSRAR
jgi:endonuclease/exonuclease/phosphatase family metal-dependent hydrolase